MKGTTASGSNINNNMYIKDIFQKEFSKRYVRALKKA